MRLYFSLALSFLFFSCSEIDNTIESDKIVNEVEFTLNGAGYDNVSYKFISYNNTRLNGARYNPATGIISCIVSDLSDGNYFFAEPANNSFWLFIRMDQDSVLDFYPGRDTTGGSIIVTKYPQAGEQIEGSFSIKGIDVRTYDVNKKIKVKGEFKVMRFSDVTR